MKKPHLRVLTATFGITGLALVATGCASSSASGEDYPTKPVTFLMPYAAGGPSDTTARAYGACMSESLDGNFVVENKDSGAGAVAMQDLASATPDGYTVGLSTNGPLVLNPMSNELSYSMEDFRALGTMAEIPTMIAVPAGSPYTDAQALFDAAKEKPGEISIGVPGATSSLAIELQRLQEETGIEFAMVPTSGSAEIITNLLGGHIDAAFINDHVDVEAHVKAGKITPLAAANEERSEAYPEIPTAQEAGHDLVTTSVYGLFAPKDLPDEIAADIEGALETCNQDPKVIEQIGDRFVPDTFSTGEETAAVFQEMHTRYEPLLGQ